jgi:predicted N-acyltransferase
MTSARVKVLESVLDVSAHAWDALVPPGAAPVLRHAWLAAMEQSGSATPERGWRATHLTLWRGDALDWRDPACVPARPTRWASTSTTSAGPTPPQQLGVALLPQAARWACRSLPSRRRKLHVARRAKTSPCDAAGDPAHRGTSSYAQDQGCLERCTCSSRPRTRPRRSMERYGCLPPRHACSTTGENPGYRTYDDYLARASTRSARHQLQARARRGGPAGADRLAHRAQRTSSNPDARRASPGRFYEATASRHAWGPVQLTRDFFRRAFADHARRPRARRWPNTEASAVAGRLQPAHAHPPLRPLLGVLRGAPVSALPRLPVPLHRRLAFAAGRATFEPGAGGEHKVSRGFEPTRVHSLHRVFEPQLEGGHSPGLRSRSSRGGPTDR